MGGGRNSDLLVAWPTADISFMDPEPAINVVYNLKKVVFYVKGVKIYSHNRGKRVYSN